MIEAPLVADRRGVAATDVAAAQRAGHVGGVDLDVVRKRENLVLERLPRGVRHLERMVVTTQEIGAGHVADEQGTA